ncbi:MAG: oligopeptide/dipeptide ABC transporter ATP-binding protein [Promethearchaeota archaeon]
MDNSIKDKMNWIVLVVSIVDLIVMIIGISAGFNLLGFISILLVICSLIPQGMIPVVLYFHIKSKGKSKKLMSIRKTIVTISLFCLILLMLSGILGVFFVSETLSLISQLLFFSPIITIIASLFTMEYEKIKREFLSPLLFLLYDLPVFLGAIFSILVLIFGSLGDPSFALFTAVIYAYILILLVVFLSAFLPCFIISFFIVNWDDRSQLLDNKIYIYLSSSLLSVITGLLLPIFVTWIFTVLFSLILKFLFLKRIPRKEVGDQLVKLEEGKDLLEVKDLKVYYPLTGGFLKRQIGSVKAVDGVSLKIKSGQTLGLVGESGCGKSTLARAVLSLVEIESGKIKFKGNEINPNKYSRDLREKIQIVYQDPDASLNPRMKAIDIVTEPLKNLYGVTGMKKLRKRALRLLTDVSLKREHLDRYPDEFSGGQKQRLVIARALATNPNLIILDEPTSALDVSVQAQILNLLKDLQRTYNYGFLFITHNLSVVQYIADQVAVMYLGRIVEIGDKEQIFTRPTHPYTQALLKSRIKIDPDSQDIKFVIDGEVPSPIAPPPGCHFNPRCSSDCRTKECEFEAPHKIKIEENHFIWCVNEPKELKYQ